MSFVGKTFQLMFDERSDTRRRDRGRGGGGGRGGKYTRGGWK